MTTKLALGIELRSVERDIKWHRVVYAGSKDQVQRERVLKRLNELEARRVALQMQLNARGA